MSSDKSRPASAPSQGKLARGSRDKPSSDDELKPLVWRAHFPEGEPGIGMWHDYAEDHVRIGSLEEEGCRIEYAYAKSRLESDGSEHSSQFLPSPTREAVTDEMIGRARDACCKQYGKNVAYFAPETDEEWRAALTAALEQKGRN